MFPPRLVSANTQGISRDSMSDFCSGGGGSTKFLSNKKGKARLVKSQHIRNGRCNACFVSHHSLLIPPSLTGRLATLHTFHSSEGGGDHQGAHVGDPLWWPRKCFGSLSHSAALGVGVGCRLDEIGCTRQGLARMVRWFSLLICCCCCFCFSFLLCFPVILWNSSKTHVSASEEKQHHV